VTSAVVVDAGIGRLVLTRRQLGALADLASGRTASPELIAGLEAGHALVDGAVHPLLRPVLRTLASIQGRGALRQWRAGVQPVAEILVGAGGVVVLPAGPDQDEPQELRWHPRPTAVARMVAELLDLPADDGLPPFDDTPRPWAELVEAATQTGGAVGLADLRWADHFGDVLTSVLVMAWRSGGGMAEVQPAEATTGGAERSGTTVRCLRRHPLEVWTVLTTLAARLT
jgi:hypothetical protein